MSMQAAKEEALRQAQARLAGVDWPARLPGLGLPALRDGALAVRAFGADLEVRLADWTMLNRRTGKPASLNDQIMILHYLGCGRPVPPPADGIADWIPFRDLPGGAFYLEPFLARTARPLAARLGDNLEKLADSLTQRFDWERVALGDFGAKIHGLGNLYLALRYSLGDAEFPPACDLLFSAGVKRAYGADDAAAFASRICLGLL
ncbi:MAG: DUF3786 domain-containing protein [Lentisphaeria bacterium]|jgi:hypothetical protein